MPNDYGLDLLSHALVVNTWRKGESRARAVARSAPALGDPGLRRHGGSECHGRVGLDGRTRRHGHGLLLWFDAELTIDIGFSNAPGQPELIYGQAFFPRERVALTEGDLISVALKSDLVDGDYLWRWNTRIVGQVKRRARQGEFSPVHPL
ncbi:MAG: hypothetical protein R3F44_17535 [Candidatus Competibacteraceae bacterium]